MLENVLITTSGNHSNEALLCAISAMGIDRVMFSADYPLLELREMVDFIDNAPISDDERRQICHENAERVLRL
jgi:2,3-dihydroxybenzoate decarboxylase